MKAATIKSTSTFKGTDKQTDKLKSKDNYEKRDIGRLVDYYRLKTESFEENEENI